MATKVPIRTAAPPVEVPAEPSPRPLPRWIPPLVILLVAVAVYANTLNNGFTLDDDRLIVRNRRIADLSYVKYMLFERGALWRPLKRMTLMLDYAVWGLGRPAGFHATNIAFHAAACLALYFFVLRLGRSLRLATVVALVFAVHPLHVEAVANISHRKESMALLFSLLAFLAYLRGRDESPRPGPFAALLGRLRSLPGRGFVRGELVVLAGLSYLAAMLSKEVGAVMLPVLIVAYEAIVAKEPWSVRRSHLIRFAPAFAAVLVLFWFRGYIGTLPRRFGQEQIEFVSQSKASAYGTMVLVAAKAFAVNVGLTVWSWPLYFDRVFVIPVGLADPWVLGGIFLAAGGVAAVLLLARRAPLASFAVAWFGISLAPVSNLVPLSYWFVAERFLYVPSVGFALLVGLAAEAVWTHTAGEDAAAARRSPATALILGLLVLCAGLTVVQNRVWKDQWTLWGHTLRYNSGSFRALYGYGLELAAKDQTVEAEGYYRKALEIAPYYQDLRVGLSLALLELGRWDEAAKEARIAAAMDPKDPAPWIAIGNVELGLGRYSAAVDAYREAVARDPEGADALYNLANAAYGNGDNAAAIEAFDQGMKKRDPSLQQWLLRGRILRRLDRAEEALAAFRRAEEIDPGNPEVPDATGRLLLFLGRRDEAARQFRRSLQLKADQPEILEIQRRYGLK